MANLGSLYYSLGIKDLTDADLKRINARLQNLGFDVTLTPKILKDITQANVPKGIKIELDPKISQEALAKAVEGKVLNISVKPLVSNLRSALREATKDNPPEMEVGVRAAKLRATIERVLNQQGFMLNLSTINDNFTKVVQQKLNGTRYTVKIHADAREITNSVQTSLMQMSSRYFGLKISRDILYRSIDEALAGHKFPIQIRVLSDQARNAVQTALSGAGHLDTQKALQLARAEAAMAAAELNRVKAANVGAANAAKAHATASVELGGAMGRNITIAGELGAAMTSIYSIHALKQFMSQVVEIGGELEHQKIAMDTIFGDKGKTAELFGQIKGLARQSPFGVMELSKSVKALSAYGVEYNEIYDTAKRLADISAATSVDINRLILAFGKTKSRGFLDGLEAKQFAYANIPIYEMVRRKLEELEGQAVTTADVMARMKKREIGFDIVKDVLWDMTDEGGKFYNMQEALAGSVKTSWKLVRDNIELMFGEIAESFVGDALKDTAQILQVLTRSWESLGKTLGIGAMAFGVYKIAVMANNQVLGKANVLAIQNAISSNKVAAANALEANTYRSLTHEEYASLLAKSGLQKLNRSLLLSHKALTSEEWDAILANKTLTKDYILRRIALGKLTQAEVEYLTTLGVITEVEQKRALSAANAKISISSLFSTIKAGGIHAWSGFVAGIKSAPRVIKSSLNAISASVNSLFIKIRSFTWSGFFSGAINGFKTMGKSVANAGVSVTKLKLAFSKLGSVASSIAGTLLNPINLIMLAIGGLTYAWQKNNEQMEKAKDIGDNIYTKATEGAGNLKKTIDEIKPSKGLSENQLSHGIEQMEQAIKDYSPTPIKDINDSLVAQDGHVRTLSERYDILKGKVESVKSAYDEMSGSSNGDMGQMVADAIKSTGDILNDSVIENAKDYTNAIQRRDQAIRDTLKGDGRLAKKAVEAAVAMNGEFSKAAKELTTIEQMWRELASNPEKYAVEWRNNVVLSSITASGIGDKNRKMKEDFESFEEDVKSFIEDLTINIRATYGKGIEELSESQRNAIAISLKTMISQADGVSEEVKMRWAKMLEDAFGVTIIEDKIGPSLIGAFKANIEKAQDASIVATIDKWKNEGYDSLSDAERQIVNDLMSDAKRRTMENLKLTSDEMQSYLTEHPLEQIIGLTYSEVKSSDYQSEVWRSSPKLRELLSETNQSRVLLDFGQLSDKAKERRALYNSWTRGSSGDFETKNRIQKELDDAYNEILASKNRSEDYKKRLQDKFDTINELAIAMGFNIAPSAKKSNKDPKEKDAFAESLKQRFKDIKDAWAEFQKWSKTEGSDAAAERIADSGLFSTLSSDEIPKTVEQYRTLVKELEEELRKAGIKGTARENLLNDILKQLFSIDKTVIDEQIKIALDRVSAEAERQLSNWNLYERIEKAIGNRNMALSIAFGVDAKATTDYPTLIRQSLDKTVGTIEEALAMRSADGESPYKIQNFTYSSLKELYDNAMAEGASQENIDNWLGIPEEIRKAWEHANNDIIKYLDKQREEVANILSEYQSLQDKIGVINSNRNRKIEAINKNQELSDSDKAKYIQRINVEADYDIFTQSTDYLKFFSGIYSLTMSQAQEIGDKIKLNLDERLQAGSLSAEDYYKEIERINQQLQKLRNVKSDSMTFLTSGIKGLKQKESDRNSSDLLSASKKLQEAEEALAVAKADGNESQIKAAEQSLENAKAELTVQEKIRDKIISDEEAWAQTLDIVNLIDNIAGGISDSFNAIRDMAGSLGFDTDSNAWLDAGAIVDTLTAVTGGISKTVQSVFSGDIGGILSGVVSTITTPFTIWSQLHDKKLDKMIEKSKEASQIMQGQYDIIEKRMASYLGNAAFMNTGVEGGAYGKQRELMKGQLEELEKQRQAEIDKKNSDDSVVRDYDQQIAEMKIAIHDFAIEAAKEVYGIDLNGWAQQIGDSLVDAFARGEDAAEAFNSTVGDIMRSVVSKMITQDLLAPMFKDVEEYLFGENGIYSKGIKSGDFVLSESDAIGLTEKLKGMQASVEHAKEIYDAINNATDGMLDQANSKTGLSAGIQSITEDTADLLASYVNAIRAYVAQIVEGRGEISENIRQIAYDALPKLSTIAQSQLQYQEQIAVNTSVNAQMATEIRDILKKNIQGTNKFNI